MYTASGDSIFHGLNQPGLLNINDQRLLIVGGHDSRTVPFTVETTDFCRL
jgi:hypothetical protein